jgi:hypothetical protein
MHTAAVLRGLHERSAASRSMSRMHYAICQPSSMICCGQHGRAEGGVLSDPLATHGMAARRLLTSRVQLAIQNQACAVTCFMEWRTSPKPAPDIPTAGATSRSHLVSPRELLKVFKSSNSEAVPDSTVEAK